MWKLSIALLAGAFVSSDASAQSWRGGGIGYYGGDQQEVGTISGTVHSIDYGNGRVTIHGADGGRRITLNADPGELAGLTPGDVISVSYVNFNGNLWVDDGYGGFGGGYVGGFGYGYGEYADEGVVVGRVSGLDKARGVVTIGGRTMRAHPEELADLLPGQFVEADFVNVDGRRWATDLSTAYGGGTTGSGIRQTGWYGTSGGSLTPRETGSSRNRGSLTPQYD